MNTLTVRRILGLLPLSCIVNIKRAHLVLEQMSNNRPGASSEFSIRTESLKSLSNFWPAATIMKIDLTLADLALANVGPVYTYFNQPNLN